MLRTFALLVVLVPAAIGGYLMMAQNQSGSAGSGPSATVLNAAATALEAQRRVTGSYAGMQTEGVTVVRADGAGYCVEALGMHLAGPGGAPEPGSC